MWQHVDSPGVSCGQQLKTAAAATAPARAVLSGIFGTVAFMAGPIPAWRAAGGDPIEASREQ
jgi:hypothetical protein